MTIFIDVTDEVKQAHDLQHQQDWTFLLTRVVE